MKVRVKASKPGSWRSLATGFVDQMLSSASNILVVLGVARVADIGQFGVVALMLTVVTAGLAVVRGGINTPLLLMGAQSDRLLRAEVRCALLVSLAFGCLLGTIVLGTGIAFRSVDLALPLACASPLVLTQDVYRYASMVRDKGRSAVAFDAVWTLASLIALASTIWLSISPAQVLWLWLVGASLSVLGQRVQSRLGASSQGMRTWWSRERAARLRYTTEGVINSIGALPLIFVLTVFVGPSASAALRGAGTVMGPISVLIAAIPIAVIPQAIRLQHKPEEIWKTLSRLALAMSALALLSGSLGPILPAKIGVQILGLTWTAAAALLPVIGIQYFALAWLHCTWALLRGTNRSRLLLRTRVANLLISTGLSVGAALIWHSALGGAIGLAVGAVLTTAVVVALARYPTMQREGVTRAHL